MNKTITQAQLKKDLHYDKDTGIFTWIKFLVLIEKGTKAGCSVDGYIAIGINGRQYRAHHLAWLYVYGEFPQGKEIDHINHIRDDNSISNLRLVTRQENNKNKSMQSRNKSGALGVYWDEKALKWRALIGVDNRLIYLGQFKEIEDAKKARKKAEKKYGFHENHGG